MAINLGNLFIQVKQTITGLFKDTRAEQERRRKAEEEKQRKIQEARIKIDQLKSAQIEPPVSQASASIKPGGKFTPGEVAKTVGNIPVMTERGLFSPTVKKGGKTYGAFEATEPRAKPLEVVTLSDLIKPDLYKGGKVGKGIAATAESVMGGLFTSGLPVKLVKPGFSPKTAVATGVLFTGIQAGLSKLRGEDVNPKDLATTFGVGAVFGLLSPKPLSGLPKTQIATNRSLLKKYGFALKDYENPATLRTKFAQTAKVLHPDKGGNPAEFKAFMDAYKNLTSAEAPIEAMSSYEGVIKWAKDLWKKTAEKKAKPTTGKEVVPVGTPGEVVTPPELPASPIPPDIAGLTQLEEPGAVALPASEAIVPSPAGEGATFLPPAVPEPIKPPKLTIPKLERQMTKENFENYLTEAKDQDDYVARINNLRELVNKPEFSADKSKIRQVRALATQEIKNTLGYEIGNNWKQNYSLFMMMKEDPMFKGSVDALQNLIMDLDSKISRRIAKEIEIIRTDMNLPAEGKSYIPYGKYSTHGTGNREWVQTNIPLIRMGNKRGMIGYVLDVLGIKQKDLPSIAGTDVSHLSEIKNVVDTFGGSGLMSNLSKKLFPQATITYNELDPNIFKAIDMAKVDPVKLNKYVSMVGKYLVDNPGSDWLEHFKKEYKSDPDFKTAAQLIEALGGRTGEITAGKMSNLIQAIPNFSKTFTGIKTSNQDAFALIDHYIKEGKPSDFLWIDPPYLWSSGYGVGSTMERAEGFMKLLDKLDKLNQRGVKFVFFNNDPEVQVEKAGREAPHLTNIVRRINALSNEGMVVIKGINPIGAAVRREMVISNLDYGLKGGRLLNLKEVEMAIKALKDDPAAAPKELLKLYRDIRNTSEFAPKGKSIWPSQVRKINALRKVLSIKNREMIPVLDELLGETSMSKMTFEDGKKLINWLQPRNWDIIESKIRLTREMAESERRERLIGDRFVAKDTEMEEKYGSLAIMNKTVGDIENLVGLMRNLPRPQKMEPGLIRNLLSIGVRMVSEDTATKLLGIKESFHSPMRRIIDIANVHGERMKMAVSTPMKDLTIAERKQVLFLQSGADKYYKGTITERAKQVANYIQELSEANIALVNRIRVAKGQPPLVAKKPYIPWIVEENLAMAANLFGGNKFWESRTKTPRDFAAGLFEHDPARIIDIWANSSSSWIKKHLWGALMQQRVDDTFKVFDPASAYAREMVMLDIYDMLPEGERFFRALGSAINKNIGSIFPKRIKVDPELAKSVLNTTFGQELRESIKNGYLEIPRIQIPNLVNTFHMIFYPLKLAFNFSFALLNRQQPWSALPFIGPKAQLMGRLRMYNSLFPWNRKARKLYSVALEESGYQFGRYVSGNKLPSTKATIRFGEIFPLLKGKEFNYGKVIDYTTNILASITEFTNRLESEYGFDSYLTTNVEKKLDIKISQEDRLKLSARFSAYINFLSGKGYSPVGQRTALGRLLYTFNQYPINMINVYSDMAKVSMKDKGAAEFMKEMGREAGITPELIEKFDKLSNKSKANVFLIFIAIAIPVATLYALSRSWNVAARALPGIPRVALSDFIDQLFNWMGDPTNQDNKDNLTKEIDSLFKPTASARLDDYFNIVDSGMLLTSSGRPIFVDDNRRNALNALIFGRSSLPEYEEAYPSILSKTFGGNTSADKVREMNNERDSIRNEETKLAVDVTKKLISKSVKTDDIERELIRLAKDNKMNDAVKDKIRGYLKEYSMGIDPFERALKDLNDEDQAQFILDIINDSTKSTEEVQNTINRYKEQKIITPNVMKEMKELMTQQEGILGAPEVAGATTDQFSGLFKEESPISDTAVTQVARIADVKNKESVMTNVPLIAKALKDEGIYSKRVMAYALATVEHETAQTFEPIEEINGRAHARRLGYSGGDNYYGRGFIQLTHDYNYKKYGERLGLGSKLVDDPSLALDKAVSARILAAYFKDQGVAEIANNNFINARRLINKDRRARSIAARAEDFLKVL